MDAKSQRWHRVTPSTFPWEDEAIDFLRSGIADADPNKAWSNFEFISGGVISEVDTFLLTRKGAYLIEIKSTPGRLVGDQQTWTFHKPDGRRTTMENPLLGANRKAKRIKSLLDRKWEAVKPANASSRPPFIQPLVFLSDPDLQVQLTADARVHVFGRDGSPSVEDGPLQGILAGAAQIGVAEVNDPRFKQLNTPTTLAVEKALEAIGIKESNRTRRVGSWVLRLDTVTERPGLQDFVADHEGSKGVTRRIRIYSRQPGMSDEQATSLQQAAEREFQATERLDHPNVVRAYDRIDTDLGSAVVLAYDPKAVRLDHWLAEQADLDISDRLDVLRQLAETLRAVHRRKVTHRALSPGSVLVRPGRSGEPAWVVQVTDFSLAGRDHTGSSTGTRGGTRTGTRFGLPTAAPGDVELLADEAAQLYQAPELFTDDDPDGVSLDVFSFGAVAFHVLAGVAPGESREAVRQVLQSSRGLQLAAVVPGVADALHELVYECTRPLVFERLSSFDKVLEGLDAAEDELTAPTVLTTEPVPAEPLDIDPLDAKVGDELGDSSIVRRRLGRGSTALALLVDRGEDSQPREVVYKVALGAHAEGRLRDEGRILAELDHPGIVKLFEQIELGGRAVLVEALAGKQSLSDELRRNGTPGAEFLQRWGVDLLDALRYLDKKGRSHRDIKPDNLGVTEIGPNKEQHLVLFDFSLAGAAASDIRAGTPPYLDPFLEERKAWDAAAELYSAAVTLYETATGETPRWADGRSDPAFTTTEVTLDTVLFDPAVRVPLEAFFAKALKRKAEERFGNAEEMATAWSQVFEALDAPVTTTPAAEDQAAEDAGEDDGERSLLPEALSLDDPISSLAASGRVVSALARLEVSTVRQLAALSPVLVYRARRISPRVRRRIVELRADVLRRFTDELASSAPPATTKPGTDAGTPTSGESGTTEAVDAPRLDLDALVPLLVPSASGRAAKGSAQPAVRLLLGLDQLPAETGGPTADWASQAAVADALGVTRGRLGQIGPAAKAHWAQLDALVSLRSDLVEVIGANGAVVAIGEVDPLVVESRGSGLTGTEALRSARAAVRAAIESEDLARSTVTEDGAPSGPRFLVRRHGARVLVALDGDATGDGGSFDGAALAAYAAALGDRADELVALAVDVVPQDRAVALLRTVTAPAGVALADGRLVRLAAASSQRVGVSSALELYPLALDPVRALRLARQGLAAAKELSIAEIRNRVRARFPQVDLPDRPDLDHALREADLAVTWDSTQAHGTGAYVRGDTAVGGLSSMTSVLSRQPTRMAPRPVGRPAVADTDPAVAVADEIEGRLHRSLDHGGFLALRVPTSRGGELRRELARFTGEPHAMAKVDLERWFLEELRNAADARGIPWNTLVKADAADPDSVAGKRLRMLTKNAAEQVEQRVLAAGPRVLAWNPGILARYGELATVDRLRSRAGLAGSDLQTLWLVTFGSTAEARPTVDGQPVPVLGPSEWLDITDAWLANRHQRLAPTGTTTRGTP